jgi:hypothetical protein
VMNGLFIAFSIVSVICSFLVIVTGVTFPPMRQRLFMKILMYISASTTIATITSSFGMVSNAPLCGLQSFFTSWLFKTSWAWTTVLSYHLYCIVFHGFFVPRPLLMHILCWVVPLIMTLLPLSTNVYGRSSDDFVLGWCYLDGNENFAAFWSLTTISAFLVVCLAWNAFFLVRIYVRYRTMDIRHAYPEVYTILRSMVLYPASFFITWFPNLMYSIVINFGGVDPDDLYARILFNALAIWATQFGTVLTFIFFYISEEARSKWYKFFGMKSGSVNSLGHGNGDDGQGTRCNEETYQQRSTIIEFALYRSTAGSTMFSGHSYPTISTQISNPLMTHSFLSNSSDNFGGASVIIGSS